MSDGSKIIEVIFTNDRYPDLELEIHAVPNGFSSEVQVFHKGVELESELRGKKRYRIHTGNNEYKVDVNVNPLEFNVEVNRDKISLGKDLNWFGKILSSIPFILFLGGIPGTVIGFLASMRMMAIMRYQESPLKYLKALGILIFTLFLCLILVVHFDRLTQY